MENQNDTYYLIGIVWVFMFLIVVAIMILFLNYRKRIEKKEKEKQSASIKAAMDAEEEQKKRIASAMHDEVLTMLAVLIQNMDLHIRDYSKGKFDITKLQEDKEIALDVSTSLRSVALELIPKVLLDVGFVKALLSYLKRLNNEHCSAELENETPFETELPFEKSIEVNIYRICLELINNLRKHDPFTHLRVVLISDGNILQIQFLHDGKGITTREIEKITERSGGLGLKSLRSRLFILKAEIDYLVEPEAAKIILTIPLK